MKIQSPTDTVNHPVRIGRPFKQGEMKLASIAVTADGVPLLTQCNVKTRWPDGSIKHAILSFVVPALRAGVGVDVKFLSISSGPPPADATLALLSTGFDVVLSGWNAQEARSARAMLVDGKYTKWCDGPVAQTWVIADHSAQRAYDFGLDTARALRPIFHVTYWPQLRMTNVRVIVENSNTEVMRDQVYNIKISDGFSQINVPHQAATRWSREFWFGASPAKNIKIDHDLPYLCSTKQVNNFDTSIVMKEADIAKAYANWLKHPHAKLYDDGGWRQAQHVVGGRDDIGPDTGWEAEWLLSGFDPRIYEIITTQANLAGSWAMHIREGNLAKLYDQAQTVGAIGRSVSVYARPALWFEGTNPTTVAADAIVITGPRITTKWDPDPAHEPEPYGLLYLLTGDYFYLEQMQFWAAKNVVGFNPKTKGPAPSAVIAATQTRGCAWQFRSRVRVMDLSPDGTPEKAYFTRIIDDSLAYWEGRALITGTQYENRVFWKFGKSQGPFSSPLHHFNEEATGNKEEHDTFNAGMVKTHNSPWQQWMFTFILGEAVIERGLEKAHPLFSWVSKMLIGHFEPGIDPHHIDHYRMPVRDANKVYFPTIKSTLPTYIDQSLPVFDNQVTDGYTAYAYGASTMVVGEPGGKAACQWLYDNFYKARKAKYAHDPKWAFAPRS